MDDLAIQLYRVDNPTGIWEYEDEAVRLYYRKRALEGLYNRLGAGRDGNGGERSNFTAH